ncbi:MAG: elongation factor P maturation arginine rhamnosyltransferase EarP [Gallionella sp.]|nr:elongation factor P maturation arginine rhamnosyltransferase EarP [Gallionella sp.]
MRNEAGLPQRCDIFCNVIDNYGDIGVCWRLARQLAHEFGLQVRLWVDDLGSFAKLCPEADAVLESQHQRGVEIRRWRDPFPEVQPAGLVIEAFGCKLPQSYVEAMAQTSKQSVPEAKMDARRQGIAEGDSTERYSEGGDAAANNADASPVVRKPVWINLEYLSAEDWVHGCHRLPSPHSSLPLTKYFFFPGFTKQTGGLLLERDLLARRDAFLGDVAQRQAYWQSLGLAMPEADTLKISLFAYENAALAGLFDAWANGQQPVLCLVPEGRVLPQVGEYFGDAESCAGKGYRRGSLEVQVLPFVEQERYDELLWACDVNFVRGEDSCVRAQWAGKPFVWQIYPQHDAVHWEKLQAFLSLYSASLSPAASEAVQGLWREWNGEGAAGAAWLAYAAVSGELDARAQDWARELAKNNLALNLLDFYQEIGRMRAFEIEGQ